MERKWKIFGRRGLGDYRICFGSSDNGDHFAEVLSILYLAELIWENASFERRT